MALQGGSHPGGPGICVLVEKLGSKEGAGGQEDTEVVGG